jgi:hypothetical protein
MRDELGNPHDREANVHQPAGAIAWCSEHAVAADPKGSLRTFRPDYYPFSSGNFHVADVVEQRDKRLQDEGRVDLKPSADLSGGRLLAYFPGADLADGATEWEPKGFFDAHSCPPEDTWVWLTHVVSTMVGDEGEREFFDNCLVAWVPPMFFDLAKEGIRVSPFECIQWLDRVDIPFVQSIRQLNLLK